MIFSAEITTQYLNYLHQMQELKLDVAVII